MATQLKYQDFPLNIPNFPKLEKKFNGLLEQFEKAGSALEQKKLMTKIGKFFDEVSTDFTIITTRHSIDTRDETYKKANDVVDQVGPMIQGLGNRYSKAVLASKFRKELETLVGPFLFKKLDLSSKTFDPKILSDLQEENKLTTAYDSIMASAQIEFDGGTYNLSQMGKFAVSKDRDVRKRASKQVELWMADKEKELADIYSQLVTLRSGMAIKLGFKSFTEMAYARMGRTDYTAKDVKSYRDQILESVVPLSNKLTRQQIKRIGVSSPKFYDLAIQFKDGNATPKGTKDDLVKAAQAMYNDMGQEIGEFFQKMVDMNLLDLEAKPGKRGGGYMTYFPRYEMPFVFANFNGTAGDVDVLTHEIGHAFQGYMSRNIKPVENRDPTMEEAEIHSMSMEFFAIPWMDKFFKEDKDKYLFGHLEGAINFLPYGVTVDEFQHWIYENPKATHEQRCAQWREIEKKYTPLKKYEGFPFYEKGTRWMRQGHIYSVPFYYIDYTLAQVVALQFLGLMKKNHAKAWKKYVKVCSMGGKYPFTELLEKAKLKNPFLEGTIKKTFAPVKRILKEYATKI
jgi:M3 family oligoendopeptidase